MAQRLQPAQSRCHAEPFAAGGNQWRGDHFASLHYGQPARPVLVLHAGGEVQDHQQRSHRVHQDVPPAPDDSARVVPALPAGFAALH